MKPADFFLLVALLLTLPIVGCEPRDEKSVDLGQNYALIRLHENVTVEDLSTPDIGIPNEVISLGFNNEIIVANTVTNQATNSWIIFKSQRKIVGPLTKEQFQTYSSTNKALRDLKLRNVWKY